MHMPRDRGNQARAVPLSLTEFGKLVDGWWFWRNPRYTVRLRWSTGWCGAPPAASTANERGDENVTDDFAHGRYAGHRFREQALEGADFSGADLRGADFS